MSAESSSPKRGFGGIFQKKTDKRDGEKSAPEKKEKKEKKKHKRQPSIASTKAWRHENCEERSEVDGAQMSSEVTAANEKEKPKNLRRRLPFGKAKPPKKKENSTEDKQDIPQEDSASNSHEGERKDEKEFGQQKVSEYESGPVDEVGESWVVLTPTDHVVSPDFTSKVFFETKETESSLPAETCPTEDDNSVKTIIPKPESPPEGPKGEKIVSSTAILWEAFTHLKQLVLNDEKLVRVDTESSSSRYEICLYAYDFSLAKLVAVWSFLLTRASEASKQILVYCISSLIRKYPQCFKVQLKKKKQRRNKDGPQEIASQTNEE
ncbi:hypothetical protein ACROYT_G018681 [Oculina patagonica]